MTQLRIALTGATGFVGAALLDLALAHGFSVDALTRRRQSARKGVTWIAGALDKPASLERLVRDADVVIHVAGVVNAPDRAGFEAGNAHGTRNLVDAMRQSGSRRLIHVSSLAAREPKLSDYGWSKQMAERQVMASGLDWTIVRPPAVYGAEDREMLELFRMAQRGLMLMPPAGKLSVIEVTDLARVLLALAEDRLESVAQIYEVDDGHAGGWSHRDLGRAIARAVGRQRARIMATPRWLMAAAAQVDRAIRGGKAKLTPDRARYFCHPDWVSQPAKGVPADIWTPLIDAADGLAATARAYRAKGWL